MKFEAPPLGGAVDRQRRGAAQAAEKTAGARFAASTAGSSSTMLLMRGAFDARRSRRDHLDAGLHVAQRAFAVRGGRRRRMARCAARGGAERSATASRRVPRSDARPLVRAASSALAIVLASPAHAPRRAARAAVVPKCTSSASGRRRRSYPTLRFLKENRDFIRARFDLLRAKPVRRGARRGRRSIRAILAYPRMLAAHSGARDSSRARERRAAAARAARERHRARASSRPSST